MYIYTRNYQIGVKLASHSCRSFRGMIYDATEQYLITVFYFQQRSRCSFATIIVNIKQKGRSICSPLLFSDLCYRLLLSTFAFYFSLFISSYASVPISRTLHNIMMALTDPIFGPNI